MSSSEKHVLVDLSHYLPHLTRSWDSQFYTGGEIEFQPNNSTYTGYTSIAGGWNTGAPVTVKLPMYELRVRHTLTSYIAILGIRVR